MRIDPVLGRRLVFAAAAAGLAARLAFGLLYWVHKPLTHDEREYLALAHSVAAGQGFVYEADRDDGHHAAIRPRARVPAVPRRNRRSELARSDVPSRVKVAQSIVGGVGGLADRRCSRGGLAGPAAGVAAAGIAAIYPPLVWIPRLRAQRSALLPMAMAAVLLLDRAIDRADTRRTGGCAGRSAAGVLTGAAILVRPAMIFFLPARRRVAGVAAAFALAALLVVTSLVVVAPWTARNFRRLRTVRARGLRGGRDVLDRQPSAGARRRRPRGQSRHQGGGDRVPRASSGADGGAARAALLSRRARLHRARIPPGGSGCSCSKAFYTVVPIGPVVYATLDVVPRRRRSPRTCSWCRSRSRVSARAGAAADRAPRGAVPAGGLRGRSSVSCFFPQERFRIPVIDPTLIVCAGTACAAADALMNVLVVVPTYNERDNLPLLARGVLAHPGFRMLVVDDGSPDGTGADCGRARRRSIPGRVEVMHRTGKRGLGRSYIDGLRHAMASTDAELICQMDADLSHNPEYLPALAAATAQRGRRDRIALSERRQRRELAAAPDLPQHVREPVHPGGHGTLADRLHQRVPVLAPRSARSGCRSTRWCRTATRSWSRCCSTRRATARRIARSADHLRRAPRGPVEDVVACDPRVGLHAVAPQAARRAPLTPCRTSS